MQEKYTLNIKCQGCYSDTSLMNIKKIGTKRLCPKCYSYIMTSLGVKISEKSDDVKQEENNSQKKDDEGSKRLKEIMRKIKKVKYEKFKN